MPIPPKVAKLVEQFDRNKDEYRSPAFNEANLRIQFVNPMFKALGWDMENEQGHAEAYKEVIHEAALKIGEEIKAPDYCFRIGGTPKFYLEAKKPAVKLKDNIEAAYQLRRYAWNPPQLPLSILTNFEEFAVYEGRVKPGQHDKASTARIVYMRYTEFADKWDEMIAGVFSQEAILKGSFDKYADVRKTKRGTAPFDAAFLEEIEGWRIDLAKNFALRNPKISTRDLNFAVQITIDRIIFLRMCEARDIEPFGQLRDLADVKDIYGALFAQFRQADDKYNSGLFHLKKDNDRPIGRDEVTPKLKLDDKVLKPLLAGLYYPKSPYVFAKIPPEILGQVYEQFLGKVIRRTPAGAKVEEKPEVKKAGGVYYTPTYIVDYIVKHTVGKLLENKSPKEASKLRILDPACGSGSFLLGAFQCLLDWHFAYYRAHDPENSEKELFKDASGEWHLTTQEKKRILKNNIFGVDIDAQAVEVTKLSLLLKVLEGETKETINSQRRLFHGERVLPDLASNIKCGNSLISPDFYDEPTQGDLFDDEEEQLRINVFDWNAAFPAIMKAGGFDAVIGNPPWGAEFGAPELGYLRHASPIPIRSTADSYMLFIGTAHQRLARGGLLGFITPDTFLRKDDYADARAFILSNLSIRLCVETGPLFSKVRDTWCLVMIAEKGKPNATHVIAHKKINRFVVAVEDRLDAFSREAWDIEDFVRQHLWISRPRQIIGYLANEAAQAVVRRIEVGIPLGELAERFRISRGEEGSKFNLRADSRGSFYIVIPADVSRYSVGTGMTTSASTLTQTKVRDFYQHPKIWIIRIQKMRWVQRLVCGVDSRRNSGAMKTLQVIVSGDDNVRDLRLLQTILSSRLINFWCINYLADDMNQSYLERIPIPKSAAKEAGKNGISNKLISLAERMEALVTRRAATQTPHHKVSLESQIAATDRQIDALVYELYGLTDTEIRTVEGETDAAGERPGAVPLADKSIEQDAEAARVLAEAEAQLDPDLKEELDRIEKLDKNGLLEAVTPILRPKQAKRLEALNRKAQDEGLTDAEERERDELLHVYEKSMVVRATALAELHKRGVDVSDLIAP